jgi:phage I-like protein
VAEHVIHASFSAFEGVDSPDKVPTEIRLMSAGVNDYTFGTLVFDADSATSVMARYAKRGLKLKADYEHQSLAEPPVIAPASARSWTPEVRDGALYATDIKWTKKARQMIADGEYDYFSIAAQVDPKTSRVVEMINFALTNNPAANGIAPLVAARNSTQEETMSKTVIVALGLSADAEESAAVAKASQLAGLEREILSLAKAKSLPEAMGVLAALQVSASELVAARAEVTALRKATVDAEHKRLCDDAAKEGRLPPAKRGEVDALYAKYGIDAVKATLSMLPVVAQSAAEAPKPVVESGATAPVASGVSLLSQFSPVEIQIARQMTGGDPSALEPYLAKLAKYKQERAAGATR